MKSTLTLFLAVTTTTLAVVCLVQSRKSTRQQTQLVSLRAELDEKAQRIESLESSGKRAKRQGHDLLRQNEDLTAQAQTRQQTEAQAVAGPPTNLPDQAASPDTPSPPTQPGTQREDTNA